MTEDASLCTPRAMKNLYFSFFVFALVLANAAEPPSIIVAEGERFSVKGDEGGWAVRYTWLHLP